MEAAYFFFGMAIVFSGFLTYGLIWGLVSGHMLRTGDYAPTPSPLETVTQSEPVEAWRVWKVVEGLGDELYLKSCILPNIWPPGKPMEITKGGFVELSTIESNNNVGIHAWKTRRLAVKYINSLSSVSRKILVVGRVYLGGEIIQHHLGYRAEEAYPAVLYIHPANKSIGQKLAQSYGCEVIYDTSVKRIIPGDVCCS